jgi:short-subunit dehydrogenase
VNPPPRGAALITGASSGIGLAIAHELARRGHPLLLVARDHGRLAQAAAELRSAHGVVVHELPCDLGEPHAAEALLAECSARRALPLEILVHNAGFGALGPFHESSPDAAEAMIALQTAFPVRFTRLALPAMLERGHGRILIVASTAAFQAGPFMAVYYACKAFLLSFAEALAEELRGSGVTVTALCPGPVPTRFQERAGVTDVPLARSALAVDAARVAREGVAAMDRGRRLVVPGLANRLLVFANRFAPRALAARIVRRLQERRATKT